MKDRNTIKAMTIEPIEHLISGGFVLASASPYWLDYAAFRSDALACVSLIEERTPSKWVGEAGSMCLRAVMITASRRGLAAVMTRHDPANPGWPLDVDAICMTFAYAADLARGGHMLGIGHKPIASRMSIIDPAEAARSRDICKMTGDERAFETSRFDDLARFIDDPSLAIGGLTSVK